MDGREHTLRVKREGYIGLKEFWWNPWYYPKRWVVIANGQVEFYEYLAAHDFVCFSTAKLEKATIEKNGDSNIKIDCGGIKTFDLRASSAQDRDNWFNALKSAQAEAKGAAEEGQGNKDIQKQDTVTIQMEQASDFAQAQSHTKHPVKEFNTVSTARLHGHSQIQGCERPETKIPAKPKPISPGVRCSGDLL
ncbi:oxysterol-binding protein [Plakobranchus ocellatus]|uniref:Oxysterol-binding protein n=1 Tax=Plakobranchus ocellatus TaxID=259542 RepID=A0AAV4CM63_9GAST|nr:oxysterol-binding protein [Plakobranchus ocellatus]